MNDTDLRVQVARLEAERDEARRERDKYLKERDAAEDVVRRLVSKESVRQQLMAAETSVDELRRAGEAMLAEYDRAFPKGQDVRTLRALPGARWFAAAEALRAALVRVGLPAEEVNDG
jgi:hypothetical protein